MASAAGIPAAICDGTAEGSLLAAARGDDVGTQVRRPSGAHARRSSSGSATRSRRAGGSLVDAGAARVLRESGSSLLPVGIVGVEGEFDAGDAVDVVSDGGPVGKGIVNYSSAELVRIKGMKSARGARAAPERLRGGRASGSVRARDEPLARAREAAPCGGGADRPRRRAGRRGDAWSSRAEPRAPARYWTAERMAEARPLDVVRGGSGPALRLAPQPPPFESFAVPDPTAPPLTTHGKLFGVAARVRRASSARRRSSRAPRAASCSPPDTASTTRAPQPSPGGSPSCPPTTAGARPFGRWTREARRGRRSTGFAGRNFDYDYATLTHAPARRAPDRGGGRRAAVGDRARRGRRSTPPTATRRTSPTRSGCGRAAGGYAGDDPRPIPGGPPPIGMALRHDHRGQRRRLGRRAGQLVSISSFGYQRRPGFLYGPYLKAKAARLVARSG